MMMMMMMMIMPYICCTYIVSIKFCFTSFWSVLSFVLRHNDFGYFKYLLIAKPYRVMRSIFQTKYSAEYMSAIAF